MKSGIRSFTCLIIWSLCSFNLHAQQYDESILALLSDIGVLGQTADDQGNITAPVVVPTASNASVPNQIFASTLLSPFSANNFALTYTDNEYAYKMSLLHTAVPLTYNAVVRNYIDAYTVRRRSAAEEILGLSTVYFPIFERYLLENNLPIELKYLAVPESGLLNHRYSPAGAAGLWQLMPVTARAFGLTVNDQIDERLDPHRSSEAAAKYLRMLYNKYHDWLLVIAAYNCGDSALDQAIRKAGGSTDFWVVSNFLPRETRSYVPQFMACSYWLNYYFDHYLNFRKPENPYLFSSSDVVAVKGGLSLQAVSQYMSIDMEQLVLLNPSLRQKVVPANYQQYELRLPITELNEFKKAEALIYSAPAPLLVATPASPTAVVSNKTKTISYTVKQGDVLGHIADWYDCSSADLKRWNGMKGDILREGDRLVVYVKEAALHKYNSINRNSFATNQRLDKVKDAQVASSAAPAVKKTAIAQTQTYTIKKGDTLSEVIRKFPKNTIKDIQRLNNLKDKDSLQPGQKLKVKAG